MTVPPAVAVPPAPSRPNSQKHATGTTGKLTGLWGAVGALAAMPFHRHRRFGPAARNRILCQESSGVVRTKEEAPWHIQREPARE